MTGSRIVNLACGDYFADEPAKRCGVWGHCEGPGKASDRYNRQFRRQIFLALKKHARSILTLNMPVGIPAGSRLERSRETLDRNLHSRRRWDRQLLGAKAPTSQRRLHT